MIYSVQGSFGAGKTRFLKWYLLKILNAEIKNRRVVFYGFGSNIYTSDLDDKYLSNFDNYLVIGDKEVFISYLESIVNGSNEFGASQDDFIVIDEFDKFVGHPTDIKTRSLMRSILNIESLTLFIIFIKRVNENVDLSNVDKRFFVKRIVFSFWVTRFIYVTVFNKDKLINLFITRI